jgi:C4-dicarboxylate-specific signal transduction histidine kinase
LNWPLAIFAMFAVMMLVMLVSNRRQRDPNRQDSMPPEGPSPREQELEEEVTDLRERIKVLERIATEDRAAKRLSSEIEQLRDE